MVRNWHTAPEIRRASRAGDAACSIRAAWGLVAPPVCQQPLSCFALWRKGVIIKMSGWVLEQGSLKRARAKSRRRARSKWLITFLRRAINSAGHLIRPASVWVCGQNEEHAEEARLSRMSAGKETLDLKRRHHRSERLSLNLPTIISLARSEWRCNVKQEFIQISPWYPKFAQPQTTFFGGLENGQLVSCGLLMPLPGGEDRCQQTRLRRGINTSESFQL